MTTRSLEVDAVERHLRSLIDMAERFDDMPHVEAAAESIPTLKKLLRVLDALDAEERNAPGSVVANRSRLEDLARSVELAADEIARFFRTVVLEPRSRSTLF